MVRNASITPIIDTPRPIVALGNDYPDGHLIPPHTHARGQVLYGFSGVVMVTTPTGTLVMPPQRGLWIPAGEVHSVRMVGAVRMRSVYIDPAAIPDMPGACQVLAISPLLRHLLAAAVDIPLDYDPAGRDGALVALLLHELPRMASLPLALPFPAHAGLVARCQAFLAEPDSQETIDGWAAALHMSRRAFTRLFRQETGLSFVEWRQQACLLAALPRLVSGEPVTTVALDLGYRNPASFTTMFRRSFGFPPRELGLMGG